jgi:tetratricopeptide (TPR) repeat protein
MMTESKAQKRVRLSLSLSIFAACLFTWQNALSLGWVPTPKEYFLLPDYCQAKMSDYMRGPVAGKIGSTSPWRREAASMLVPASHIPRWKQKVGSTDFLHLHHYCHGLAIMSSAEDPGALRKSGYSAKERYAQAVKEIDYTRSKSRPGAPLWDVMSIAYARALAGAGQWSQSKAVFEDVIASSPRDPDAWVEYAKLLKRRGEINDAISLLEQGLKMANNSGPLLYWLAIYQYDLGDLTRAAETAQQAQAAGMKMDSLTRKLRGAGRSRPAD